MLKFFRKIRHKLLTDNKFSKYLLYAIGEILLVVIGILIALWINSEYQYNKDRKSEAVYLTSILNDINADIKEISDYLDDSERQLDIFQESLIWFNDAELPNESKYLGLISSIGLSRILDFQKSTFLEMQSSGKLDLISSYQLKMSIISYYDLANITIEKQQENSHYSSTEVRSYERVSKLFDLNSIFSVLIPDTHEIDPFEKFPFNKVNHPDREEFSEMISTLIFLSNAQKSRIESSFKEAEKLKRKLEIELSK